ncbi:hypothetical protein ACN26Y_28560 [Micromonospora sp. WMMD558]|uniref:hypothetical protein n=1 Tax=Micromonospora sp. WMMD558 TaxID=3403462 RepID=UPI003BF46F92
MTTPDAAQQPPTLESVLRQAWDAFHPGQPAPLGWLTHTTTQLHAYLREQHPTPPAPPSTETTSVTRLRRQMWQALRDATAEHDIDPDVADRILHNVDLPGLPRRWQVRLTLPVKVEVTATSREDAFDTAEDLINTALAASGHDSNIDWDAATRDDATPGDLDTAGDEPADLR